MKNARTRLAFGRMVAEATRIYFSRFFRFFIPAYLLMFLPVALEINFYDRVLPAVNGAWGWGILPVAVSQLLWGLAGCGVMLPVIRSAADSLTPVLGCRHPRWHGLFDYFRALPLALMFAVYAFQVIIMSPGVFFLLGLFSGLDMPFWAIPAFWLLVLLLARFLFCAWFLALPVLHAEQCGPIVALRRSWALTKGSRGKLFGFLVLLQLVDLIEATLLAYRYDQDWYDYVLVSPAIVSVKLGLVAAVMMAAYRQLAAEGRPTGEPVLIVS